MLKPATLSNISKNQIPNNAAITYASIVDLARHGSKLHVSSNTWQFEFSYLGNDCILPFKGSNRFSI
ncbi:hypothetical protein T07_523 [Trichinella nelsoni]|uniref:Uncharacterized protein n=1 Tax=Trichinella nelsoni TaxID=6336 RepID=A0A0V0RCQ5_9BILA|nr:hypothetical protein T07_10434 [Trichinella nelsoni]KRX12299.1 hypothetical protein T07_523 [Trichinella nelsoni]